MTAAPGLDRRAFHKLAGAGVMVAIGLGPAAAFAQGRPAYPADFHAYLNIGEDGRETVFSGKVEMGQGVTTSLAQMAAEELGVDLDHIDMVMGDTASCPWDMGTFGSMTSRIFGPALSERRRWAEADRHHHASPRELMEVPTVESRPGGHDPAPGLAACSIASTMRVWAPQRQRLWSIRATMASRAGCGVSWSRA